MKCSSTSRTATDGGSAYALPKLYSSVVLFRWTVRLRMVCTLLLLLCGKGCTSFVDVRTVDAVEHPSSVAAARAAGYFRDYAYFTQSLREASSFYMHTQLRSYYVSAYFRRGSATRSCAPLEGVQK